MPRSGRTPQLVVAAAHCLGESEYVVLRSTECSGALGKEQLELLSWQLAQERIACAVETPELLNCPKGTRALGHVPRVPWSVGRPLRL